MVRVRDLQSITVAQMKDDLVILETLLHRRLDRSLRHDANFLPALKAVKQEGLATCGEDLPKTLREEIKPQRSQGGSREPRSGGPEDCNDVAIPLAGTT